MRILLCCQFYAPSVGGVQEVIRQIGERLVASGHQVTVATTRLPERDFKMLNGVAVKGFDVAGNLVGGMTGEVGEYQEYVLGGAFDVVMIYAAQQWTFDALWPILDRIRIPKVFVPCGFSGLYEPGYAKYFQQMPEILRRFDSLVFHATNFRDINFAREHGIGGLSIIPNGADEKEFNVAADPLFRSRQGISGQSFLFLTVGSFSGLKGHLELAKAFSLLKLEEAQHATLILNGNEVQLSEGGIGKSFLKLVSIVRTHGSVYAIKQIWKRLLGTGESPREVARLINKSQPNKKVLVTNFPRKELTQAFMAADLFVFASNVEYSPLVLYESAAAGTPFLTVDVGNAAEIAQWTGAGVMCPSAVDEKGYTRVSEAVLAQAMTELMQQRERLEKLGGTGKKIWAKQYTWRKIAEQYEQLFLDLLKNR